MGNLGLYQVMVWAAKKVGGPLVLAALVASAGAAVKAGIDVTIEKVRDSKENKKKKEEASVIYTITKEGVSHEGLIFKAGEKFRILIRDGDIGLIERLNDPESPYVVSLRFLSSISDYAMV